MLKLFQEWGKGGIKDNDGRVNSTMAYCKYFVNVTMHPQNSNNMVNFFKVHGKADRMNQDMMVFLGLSFRKLDWLE
jgi:hypothetical protein